MGGQRVRCQVEIGVSSWELGFSPHEPARRRSHRRRGTANIASFFASYKSTSSSVTLQCFTRTAIFSALRTSSSEDMFVCEPNFVSPPFACLPCASTRV